jgi:hypothetical protein
MADIMLVMQSIAEEVTVDGRRIFLFTPQAFMTFIGEEHHCDNHTYNTARGLGFDVLFWQDALTWKVMVPEAYWMSGVGEPRLRVVPEAEPRLASLGPNFVPRLPGELPEAEPVPSALEPPPLVFAEPAPPAAPLAAPLAAPPAAPPAAPSAAPLVDVGFWPFEEADDADLVDDDDDVGSLIDTSEESS